MAPQAFSQARARIALSASSLVGVQGYLTSWYWQRSLAAGEEVPLLAALTQRCCMNSSRFFVGNEGAYRNAHYYGLRRDRTTTQSAVCTKPRLLPGSYYGSQAKLSPWQSGLIADVPAASPSPTGGGAWSSLPLVRPTGNRVRFPALSFGSPTPALSALPLSAPLDLRAFGWSRAGYHSHAVEGVVSEDPLGAAGDCERRASSAQAEFSGRGAQPSQNDPLTSPLDTQQFNKRRQSHGTELGQERMQMDPPILYRANTARPQEVESQHGQRGSHDTQVRGMHVQSKPAESASGGSWALRGAEAEVIRWSSPSNFPPTSRSLPAEAFDRFNWGYSWAPGVPSVVDKHARVRFATVGAEPDTDLPGSTSSKAVFHNPVWHATEVGEHLDGRSVDRTKGLSAVVKAPVSEGGPEGCAGVRQGDRNREGSGQGRRAVQKGAGGGVVEGRGLIGAVQAGPESSTEARKWAVDSRPQTAGREGILVEAGRQTGPAANMEPLGYQERVRASEVVTGEDVGKAQAETADAGESVADSGRAAEDMAPVRSDLGHAESANTGGKSSRQELQREQGLSSGEWSDTRKQGLGPTHSRELPPSEGVHDHNREGSKRRGRGRVQKQVGKEVWRRQSGASADQVLWDRTVHLPRRLDQAGRSQWAADFGGWWEDGAGSRRIKAAELPKVLPRATLMTPVSEIPHVSPPPQMLSWAELMQQVKTPAEVEAAGEKQDTLGLVEDCMTGRGKSAPAGGSVTIGSGAVVDAVPADASQITVDAPEAKTGVSFVDQRVELEGGCELGEEVSRGAVSGKVPQPDQIEVDAPGSQDMLSGEPLRSGDTVLPLRSEDALHAIKAAVEAPKAVEVDSRNGVVGASEDLSKAATVTVGDAAVEEMGARAQSTGAGGLSPALARLMSEGEAMSVQQWEQLRGKLKTQGKKGRRASEESGTLEPGVRKAGKLQARELGSKGIGENVGQGRVRDAPGDAVVKAERPEGTRTVEKAAVDVTRKGPVLDRPLAGETARGRLQSAQPSEQGLLRPDQAVEDPQTDTASFMSEVALQNPPEVRLRAREEGMLDRGAFRGAAVRPPFAAQVVSGKGSESFSEMLARLTAEGRVVPRKERKRLFDAWAKSKSQTPVRWREEHEAGPRVPVAAEPSGRAASERGGVSTGREAPRSEVLSEGQQTAELPRAVVGESAEELQPLPVSQVGECPELDCVAEVQKKEAVAPVGEEEGVPHSQKLGVVAEFREQVSSGERPASAGDAETSSQPSETAPERVQTSAATSGSESAADSKDTIVGDRSGNVDRPRIPAGSFAALVARSRRKGRALLPREVERLWDEWKVGKTRTRGMLIEQLAGVGSVEQVAALVRKHGQDVMAKDAVQILKALRAKDQPGSAHLFFQWCCSRPDDYAGDGILSRYLVAQAIPAAATIGRLDDIERLLIANAAAYSQTGGTAPEDSNRKVAGSQSAGFVGAVGADCGIEAGPPASKERVPGVLYEAVPNGTISLDVGAASECFLADVFVCNAMLEAYVESGRWQEALGFFERMHAPEKKPLESTVSTKPEGDGEIGTWDNDRGTIERDLGADQEQSGEQLTELGSSEAGEKESATRAGIVREDYGWLEEIFQEWLHQDQKRRGGLKHWKDGLVLRLPRGLSGLAHSAPRNVFSYNLAMRACLRGNLELAHVWALRDRMEKEGLTPDRISYNLTIAACCKLPEGSAHFNARARGEDVLMLIDEMELRGIPPNVYTYTGAVVAWARANQAVSLALRRPEPSVMVSIFNRAMEDGQEPNVVTYGALIHGFAQMGELDNAEVAFEDLLESGIPPNEGVLHALLAGCELAGDFERARQWVTRLESDGLHCSEQSRVRLLSVRVHTGGADEVVERWEVLREQHGSELAGMRALSRELVGGQPPGIDDTPETGGDSLTAVPDRCSTPLAGANLSRAPEHGTVRPPAPGLSEEATGRGPWGSTAGKDPPPFPENDVALYKILIQALGKCGKVDEIAPVVQAMARVGCMPDAVLCNILLDTCARVTDWTVTDAIVEALGSLAQAAEQQERLSSSVNPPLVDGVFAMGSPGNIPTKDGGEIGSVALPHQHAAGGNRHPLPASFFSTTTELLTTGLNDADVKTRTRRLMSILRARGESPETILAFFSTLCDALWSFGWEKRVSLIAGALLGSGFQRGFKDRRPVSKANDKEWILDVRRLGKGAGQAVMFLWLQRVRGEFEAGESAPGRITIVTGHPGHKWAKGELRTVIGDQLIELDSPLQPRSERNPGKFTAFGWEVRDWLLNEGMEVKLALSDGADERAGEDEQEPGIVEAYGD